MTDLERLNKAIKRFLVASDMKRSDQPNTPYVKIMGPSVFDVALVLDAARLLANGGEPDYEAAAIRLCHWDGIDYGEPYDEWPTHILDSDGTPWEPYEDALDDYRDRARAIVDAAIGDRLLINPPTEEE